MMQHNGRPSEGPGVQQSSLACLVVHYLGLGRAIWAHERGNRRPGRYLRISLALGVRGRSWPLRSKPSTSFLDDA